MLGARPCFSCYPCCSSAATTGPQQVPTPLTLTEPSPRLTFKRKPLRTGSSRGPNRRRWSGAFDNIARLMERFFEAKRVGRYALCMQDFGGPIGFLLPGDAKRTQTFGRTALSAWDPYWTSAAL